MKNTGSLLCALSLLLSVACMKKVTSIVDIEPGLRLEVYVDSPLDTSSFKDQLSNLLLSASETPNLAHLVSTETASNVFFVVGPVSDVKTFVERLDLDNVRILDERSIEVSFTESDLDSIPKP
ncbi:MAG: hypothetical protein ACI9OU_002026 [Candidatus Promineifilaceae bacterium]|jgi:hypothetical protein